MNDSVYQSHFQNYASHIDSASAMQLAYYQTAHNGQHWSNIPYVEDSCARTDSIYEFADPSSNLEQDMGIPYSGYSPSSGYQTAPLDGLYYPHETASSHIVPETMYDPPSFQPSESFSTEWPNGSGFHHMADMSGSSVRYAPYPVKSQRPIDVCGTESPSSPLSLARSKRSSTSPSPGPLTPATGHISLQTELDSRPTSSGSSHSLYRTEEVDPDRPYPCNSCRMAFARQHDLTRHTRVHSGETPYHCHGCRQGFRRSDARSRHWGKEPRCLAVHQQLVEGTEEGRKLQKSLQRLGEKVGRVGTTTFRVHKPPVRSIRGTGVHA